jgi:Domain of unknown function (DUF397)
LIECGLRRCRIRAREDGDLAVRDSKDPDGVRLAFTVGEWAAFTAAVKAGEFDVA